jgi:hypothetical protein
MVHMCTKAISKNYSSKEDELEVIPILVRYFVITSTTPTTFATWCGVNSWQCSSVIRNMNMDTYDIKSQARMYWLWIRS